MLAFWCVAAPDLGHVISYTCHSFKDGFAVALEFLALVYAVVFLKRGFGPKGDYNFLGTV
jgi:hypothetical protein